MFVARAGRRVQMATRKPPRVSQDARRPFIRARSPDQGEFYSWVSEGGVPRFHWARLSAIIRVDFIAVWLNWAKLASSR
jgi:hypothetical protein